MLTNKKLDRLKQWAGERMGGEVKTMASDDFKALETDMALRQEGMEKLHKSMNIYIKSLSKRNESEYKEKTLPVSYLGSTMISHAEDFEADSEFGSCLSVMGRTNEKIGHAQEAYITQAISSWLMSLERSLIQMKEYQVSRKKLEQRRLAYDTALAKMQRAKKEDFRFEEELRSQKAKYDESREDVLRRMQDIKEGEIDSISGLSSFLEAELVYHDKCREALLSLKKSWPSSVRSAAQDKCNVGRSSSNTASLYSERQDQVDGSPIQDPKFRRLPSRTRSEQYSASSSRVSQIQMESSAAIPSNIPQLRQINKEIFDEPSENHRGSSYNCSGRDKSNSPVRSLISSQSRPTSSRAYAEASMTGAKGKTPPCPPPSRTRKPPPPPPPMKRSTLINHKDLQT